MKLDEVARKYHTDASKMRERLVLAGVQIRPRGRPALERPRAPQDSETKRRRRYGRSANDPWAQPTPATSALTTVIVGKFDAGMPIPVIAESLRLSETTVIARLAREGLGPEA